MDTPELDHKTFDLAAALRFEGREGAAPLRAEAAKGAERFVGGAGRSGRFD